VNNTVYILGVEIISKRTAPCSFAAYYMYPEKITRKAIPKGKILK
jgi:hypothetical protein